MILAEYSVFHWYFLASSSITFFFYLAYFSNFFILSSNSSFPGISSTFIFSSSLSFKIRALISLIYFSVWESLLSIALICSSIKFMKEVYIPFNFIFYSSLFILSSSGINRFIFSLNILTSSFSSLNYLWNSYGTEPSLIF